MTAELSGQVAIVTGGSRGIGEAIARRFAASGASVLITGRSQETLDATAARIGGDVLGVAAHVAEDGAADRCIDAALSRWGRIDVLCNNAAVNPHAGPLASVTRSQFQKIVDVNLWGPLDWTNRVVAAGLGTDDSPGSVVNIVSNVALMYGPPVGPYSTSKAALIHITRQLAVELGPRVRVNAIAPGVVDTVMARGLVSQGVGIAARWPIPRIGHPDDIAAAALFLASGAASWITGHVLVVDGGASLLSDEVTLAPDDG
jgi:NAD(P)-dependent dehydrogenase (short-subunit alcohol dehydrogenase family)